MASKVRYVAAAAIVVLGLGGCASSGSSADDQATSYCESLASLSDIVAQKDTFSDATPTEEIRDWSRDVASAVEDVVAAGRDLTEANTDQLSDSFDDVRSTVDDELSDAETLGDVRTALVSGADELQVALGDAQQTYDCEATPAATS